MKDKHEEEDKLFEGLYYHLGKLQTEESGAYLDQIEADLQGLDYPKDLDDWFAAQLKEHEVREQKSKRKKMWRTLAKSVAIFLVVLTAGLGVTTFSVQAFKIKLFNMVSEITSQYTKVEFVETDITSDKEVVITWPSYLYPQYLPEGFMVDEVQEFGNTRLIYFGDPSGNTLEFSQSSDSSSFQVDTEQANSQKVKINNEEGWLIHKDNFSTLVWKRGDLTLYLMGNLSDQELVKVAEGIGLVEK